MTDWNDAFDNIGHIPQALSYFDRWQKSALTFRQQQTKADCNLVYGPSIREKLDLFWPQQQPKGLVIFVHGGFWMKLGREYFSHLAKGPLAHGWAVALPSHTLAPKVRISEISQQIARSIEFAANQVEGNIQLVGHSAGGHLVTRMLCLDGPLSSSLQARIQNAVSISGVHDLKNLLKTDLNHTLKLFEQEAEIESPVSHQAMINTRLACWVGADERPEFIRQNSLLQTVWGKDTATEGTKVTVHVAPNKHHFNVIDALEDPSSEMLKTLLPAN